MMMADVQERKTGRPGVMWVMFTREYLDMMGEFERKKESGRTMFRKSTEKIFSMRRVIRTEEDSEKKENAM